MRTFWPSFVRDLGRPWQASINGRTGPTALVGGSTPEGPRRLASTATQAETYLHLHAYPALGQRPIGTILRSEIQAWVKSLSGALTPGSVEVLYRWVSTIFKAAVGDRLIAASPCVRVALPKRTSSKVVPLGVVDVPGTR